jgi:hypothetical protein
MSVIHFQPGAGLATVGAKPRGASHWTKEHAKFVLNRLIGYESFEESEPNNIALLLNRTFPGDGVRSIHGILSKIGGDIIFELKTKHRDLLDNLFAAQMGFSIDRAKIYTDAILNSVWEDDDTRSVKPRITIFSRGLQLVTDPMTPESAELKSRLFHLMATFRFNFKSIMEEDSGLSDEDQRRMITDIFDKYRSLGYYLARKNLVRNENIEQIKLACRVFKPFVVEAIDSLVEASSSKGPFTFPQIMYAMKQNNPPLFRNHAVEADQLEKAIINLCKPPDVAVFGAPKYESEEVIRLIFLILRGKPIEDLAKKSRAQDQKPRTEKGIKSKLLGDFLALITTDTGAAKPVYAVIKDMFLKAGLFDHDDYVKLLIESSLGTMWSSEGGFKNRISVFDANRIAEAKQRMANHAAAVAATAAAAAAAAPAQ